jgi:hypothetical protein
MEAKMKNKIQSPESLDADFGLIGTESVERSLTKKTGFFKKKFDVDSANSEASGEGIKIIHANTVQSQVNIALAAQQLAEAKITTALVASAIGHIGANIVNLNAKTTSVDQCLVNGVAAETVTHYQNRKQTISLAQELFDNSSITEDEAKVIIQNAVADGNQNINRSRERMLRASNAVAILHDSALNGIINAKNIVSKG